jgi:hypothetical protein
MQEKITDIVTYHIDFTAPKIYYFELLIGSREFEMNLIYF